MLADEIRYGPPEPFPDGGLYALVAISMTLLLSDVSSRSEASILASMI
jgi:hypothetical protein